MFIAQTKLLLLLERKVENIYFFLEAANQNIILRHIHTLHWVVEIYFKLRNFQLKIKNFQGSIANQGNLLCIHKFGHLDRIFSVIGGVHNHFI